MKVSDILSGKQILNLVDCDVVASLEHLCKWEMNFSPKTVLEILSHLVSEKIKAIKPDLQDDIKSLNILNQYDEDSPGKELRTKELVARIKYRKNEMDNLEEIKQTLDGGFK